jgi:two-component system, response regulator RegA
MEIRSPPIRSVLIADNSHTSAELSRQFRQLGCDQVWAAETADEALNVALVVKPELTVLELRLPDHDGFFLLRELRDLRPEIRCAIVTAYGSIAATVKALKMGAVACLSKPATALEILRACDDRLGWTGQLVKTEHMSLQRAVWEYLTRVFLDSGSVSEAARRLGIDRRSLRRMLSRNPPA